MIRISGLVLSSIILSGCLATSPKRTMEAPVSAKQNVFGHMVPEGAPTPSQAIVSTNHPGVHQKLTATPWRIAHFRPNVNMPEVLNADIINNTLSEEKVSDLQRKLSLGKEAMWSFPRIRLLPCDNGCAGNKDYEKMAARFLESYNDMVQSGSGGVYRGEMKIKVRWFRKKSLIERVNPLSFAQNAFGISFPIEGNMLTLSTSAFGKDSSIEDCVDSVATKFKIGIIFPVSLGVRNYFTVTLDPQYDPSLMQKLNSFATSPVRGMQNFLGQSDYSSRLEPITDDHIALLPAIDGLQAGDGIDVGQGKLFDSF